MKKELLELENIELTPRELGGNGLSGNGLSGNRIECKINEIDYDLFLKEFNF